MKLFLYQKQSINQSINQLINQSNNYISENTIIQIVI